MFELWAGTAAASGLASPPDYVMFGGAPPAVVTATQAAGAILAMISDIMLPEAFETVHGCAGLITVVGFLAAFVLSKPGG